MKLIVLSFAILTSVAMADDAMKAENFEKMKAEKLSHYDQRITNLQTAKACVSSATNVEGMKACHKEMKGKMKELHKERQSRRKEWKEEKRAKREEKKK